MTGRSWKYSKRSTSPKCAQSAAKLAGCDSKTVRRYVTQRDEGRDPLARARRDRITDPFLHKVEELVERSRGEIRAEWLTAWSSAVT